MRCMTTLIFAAVLLVPFPANAYVGPGLGLGVIGAILGVVLSVVLALFGLLWYPIKRLLGKGARRKG